MSILSFAGRNEPKKVILLLVYVYHERKNFSTVCLLYSEPTATKNGWVVFFSMSLNPVTEIPWPSLIDVCKQMRVPKAKQFYTFS